MRCSSLALRSSRRTDTRADAFGSKMYSSSSIRASRDIGSDGFSVAEIGRKGTRIVVGMGFKTMFPVSSASELSDP